MEGSQCQVCFVGSLMLSGGLLVCDACGNISQDFAEETQEFQDGVSNVKYFRRDKRARVVRSQPVEEPTESAPLAIKEGVHAYVACVQQLLRSQAQMLFTELSVSKGIIGIVRGLWFDYLSSSRILDASFATALEAKVKDFEGKKESENLDVFKTFYQTNTMIENEISRLRETISPLDIAGWALDGKLPYMAFGADSREKLLPFRGMLSSSFLNPGGTPSPFSITNRAVEIAHAIDLPCPQINTEKWLDRFVRELELPHEVVTVASLLCTMYRTSHPSFNMQHLAPRHPWGQLMAVIVVAVKIVCAVDSDSAILSGCSAAPSMSWIDWAKSHVSTNILTSFPWLLKEATHSNPAVSRLYSEKLRRADFASFAPPDMLAEYQSLFDRLSSNRLETQEECQEAKTKELWHRPAVVGSTSKGQGSYKWFGKAKNSISALPTEYLAVLITCASRVWMVPKYLHEIVTDVEHAMLDAETTVAYKHASGEQEKVEKIVQHARNGMKFK